MKPRAVQPGSQRGSVLIIVLWIALGLVVVTLYFANSMSFELRGSDNRVASVAADQAIEGAARYVKAVLTTLGTNGVLPDVTSYQCQAVPVGEAHFWLIGRPSDTNQVQPDQVFFGLVDEASKLNLNTVTADMLIALTNMNLELAANLVDWRSTNGTVSANGDGPSVYGRLAPPYYCKAAPFETVDELRLVFAADMPTLVGEDINRNGVLDANEYDTNRNGFLDPGLLEYVTVYSREPNANSDGSPRTNIRSLSAAAYGNLITQAGGNAASITAGGGRGGRGGGGGQATYSFASPLDFYIKSHAAPIGLTLDQFATIASNLTVSTGTYITGRINVNTASAAVLACLPGLTPDLVPQLTVYRLNNPTKLTSVAWVAEALGETSAAAQTLAAGDYLTTQSYQCTADVAALGPHGRGYRRVKFVFDTSGGTPQIVYRQDLSHLGWALGRYVRQAWLMAQGTR